MHGRIMIVETEPRLRAQLRVALATACYETEQAESIEAALRLAQVFRPDVVIFSDTLPGADPARFVTRLGSRLPAGQIPTLYLQSRHDPRAGSRAIEAGVEDAIRLPLDTDYLLARLRCIFRKLDTDREALHRDDADRALELAEAPAPFVRAGRIALVPCDPGNPPAALIDALQAALPGPAVRQTPQQILRPEAEGPACDLFVLFGTLDKNGGSLALLSELRARHRTRHAAILFVAAPSRQCDAACALDLGADDAILWDRAQGHILALCDRLVARHRAAEAHRLRIQTGLEAALIDPLTGLWNRRYALPNLDRMLALAKARGTACSVMIADLDHFKRVNDRHGHMTGDAVLRAVAMRLKAQLGNTDVISRIGGEEFLIILPQSGRDHAEHTARRLMTALAQTPVPVPQCDAGIPVSISIGIAVADATHDAGLAAQASGADLLAEADRALYGAKADGRARIRLARIPANDSDAAPSGGTPMERDQRRDRPARRTSSRSA